METPKTKIVTPILTSKEFDKKSYWSMFYYAAISTIIQQKTLTYRWSSELKSLQSYKGQIIEHSFFSKMLGSIKNHGFEYLMVEFLRSEEGWDAFQHLCDSILEDHGVTGFPIKYFSINKTGVDYLFYNDQLKHNTKNVNFLLPNGQTKKQGSIITSIGEKNKDTYSLMIENSDIYIEVTDGYERFAFVGEVEGNDGDKMLRKSFFKGLKGLYSTFGISASNREKYKSVDIDEPVTVLWAQDSGHWILNFKKSDDFYRDYITAIENLNKLISGNHMNLQNELRKEPEHSSVLEKIINHWSLDKNELLESLSTSIDYITNDDKRYNLNIQSDDALLFAPSQLIMSDGVQYYKVKKN